MRSIMKKIISFLCAIVAIFLVGCAKTTTTDTFRFQVREPELILGETKKLDIIMGSIDINEEIISEQVDKTEESGEIEILNSEKGVVEIKATKVGEVILSTYVKSKSNVKDTIVIQISHPRVDMLRLVCNQEDPTTGAVEVYIGSTIEFTLEATPVIENANFIYEVSDTSLAKAEKTNKGVKLTGLAKGTVSLKAYEENDPSFAIIKSVNVKYYNAASVKTEYDTYNLEVGDSLKINAVAYGSDGKTDGVEQAFIYTTNQPLYVKISDDGTITASKNGTYKITVISKDRAAKTEVKLVVTYPTEVKVDTLQIKFTTSKQNFSRLLYVQNLLGELVEGEGIIEISEDQKTFKILAAGTCKVKLMCGEYSKVITIVITE